MGKTKSEVEHNEVVIQLSEYYLYVKLIRFPESRPDQRYSHSISKSVDRKFQRGEQFLAYNYAHELARHYECKIRFDFE